MKKNIEVLLPLAVCIAVVASYGLLANDYAFWRHDAWGYSANEVLEFKESGRWLAPFIHLIFKFIPHYLAWCLSVLFFWYFGYVIVARNLPIDDIQDRLFAATIASFIVITPGFLSQLNWPIHSLSSICILVLMQFFMRTKSRVKVVIIGTVLLMGTHQGFALLTLLLLTPTPSEITGKSRKDVFKKMLLAISIWILSILLGVICLKALQLIFFGEIPSLPPWRHANPATSISHLFDNTTKNIHIFIDHFTITYTKYGWGLYFIAFAAVFSIWRNKRIENKSECVNHSLVFLAMAALLYLSVYLVTSPIGVILMYRTSFVFGPATLCVAIALFLASKSRSLVSVTILIFLVPSISLAHANLKWYANVSSDLNRAIVEIEEKNPEELNGVIIDATEPITGFRYWVSSYTALLSGRPLIFEPLTEDYRLRPALIELGYRNVAICRNTESSPTDLCTKMKTSRNLGSCSAINSDICSLGVTNNGYWLIKFW